MQIKHIIFILVFLFIGKDSDDETMAWQESRKLTWSDFKASPNGESDAVALTASGITFGYSVKTAGRRITDFSTSVEAHFYPNKSWYFKNRGTDYILAHEQLHFDITELYVRMFREQLTKLQVNQNVKEQMQRLHKKINVAVDETQKRYDAQSNHSINAKAQKQWEVFIAKELKNLDQYKSN
ncbi:DUF922 domain-containing protein [Winogradskyella sp. UBA3174]|uniref:DUF922 domain-containing protein n=1 Tax=Winogradskyella sp. UBA3174 TaxID=1947785 RepID=UPI0025FF022E|nr:DUF922 domain-containing protein [Winogradskyella sp. UBA3174]|tara:strand:+ start:7379 stop:7924 length:546 start_codon:yes stop_codon:yes gene_type:complete